MIAKRDCSRIRNPDDQIHCVKGCVILVHALPPPGAEAEVEAQGTRTL